MICIPIAIRIYTKKIIGEYYDQSAVIHEPKKSSVYALASPSQEYYVCIVN